MRGDEIQRLQTLWSTGLLDSEPEPFFDAITRVASVIVDAPISLVSLIDADRQWFKSKQGLGVSETPRNISFCTHAVDSGEMLLVENALEDNRFKDNPLVKGEPDIRFYAGIPIKSIAGYSLGTLCVIDTKPKKLTQKELKALGDLADLATQEIQLREKLHDARLSEESSRSKFETLFNNAAIGIAIVEPSGRWKEVNNELCEIIGYTKDELQNLTFQDITHPEDLNTDLNLLDQLIAGKIDRYQLEKRYIKKNGEIIWIELTVTKQLKDNGEINYFNSVIKNIHTAKQTDLALTALRQTLEDQVRQRTEELRQANESLLNAYHETVTSEQKLKDSENQLKTILENANDAYVCMDMDGFVQVWNKQAEITFGWPESEAIGKRLDKLIIPEEHRTAHQHGMKRYAIERTSQMIGTRIELEAVRKDGSRIPVELHVNVIEINNLVLFSAFLRDITDRKKLELLLKKEAHNDPLTGLPNRRKIDELLPLALDRAKANDSSMSVLFLDLDGFKSVNDNYGHHIGDLLLIEVTTRIDKLIRKTDMFARYAGDEFIIILEGINDIQISTSIAQKILNCIAKPFNIGNNEIRISVSIGLVDIKGKELNGTNAIDIVRLADKAMYDAKRSGKNGVYRFNTY